MRRTRLPLRRILFSKKLLLILGMSMWVLASCARRSQYTANPTPAPGWPKARARFSEARYPVLRVAYPQIADAEFINDDELCITCHETYVKTFAHNVHRGQKCEDCHGPASRHVITRGKEPGLVLNFKKLDPAARAEICLKCHQENQCKPGARWRTSVHAHNGVSCTDCHTSHYNVPPGTPATTLAGSPNQRRNRRVSFRQEEQPPVDQAAIRAASNHMGAMAPQVCYRCHSGMRQFERIAGPHQILGVNGFNCTTCHDPHGKVLRESREKLCLQCHKKHAPTMAWQSSIHGMDGVNCTDCHNPHPHTQPKTFVRINHYQVRRPKRLPMSVQEPDVCYKCHTKIYGLNQLPSHHPIREGKMVCSNCHDPHGQFEGNLKAEKVNYVCYKCHADKAGPFAYEHPPVTQDCSICHEPHGTVANNLLRQPPNFLCLRCHSGHRGGPGFHDGTNGLLPDFANGPPAAQRAFFSDCTQCHSQIHGSNIPSPHRPGAFMR